VRALNRRGFTLIELIIAVMLLTILGVGIYRVLVSTQRFHHAQTQRVELQQTIRTAASLFAAELRELDASDGDIYALSPTFLAIRAMRQTGFLCAPPVLPAGAVSTFIVRKDLFFGPRNFHVGRDSLLLYYEGDEGTRADDGWVLARPTSIVDGECPAGDPGWRITASLSFGVAQMNTGGTQRIPNGSPVRGFVPVRYHLYQSSADGRWYVGYDELTDAAPVQPLIGPVSAHGLTIVYYDSTGAVTASRTLVQMIEVRLHLESSKPVHRAGGGGGLTTPVDSVVTRVALRNNRRW
jgi:prepilin-type N-terminal cleavage/methylation domain-containing protein